ncbi:hypothetical protein Taro_004648 [Colocasia esculenta]|uniref:Uncharacterized protein n=1 Tax=Colocasia esculenta TaxID=4460 RepID=A0A843TMU8_COLES|nr:hypothetical protein [Colocasia esculenta]
MAAKVVCYRRKGVGSRVCLLEGDGERHSDDDISRLGGHQGEEDVRVGKGLQEQLIQRDDEDISTSGDEEAILTFHTPPSPLGGDQEGKEATTPLLSSFSLFHQPNGGSHWVKSDCPGFETRGPALPGVFLSCANTLLQRHFYGNKKAPWKKHSRKSTPETLASCFLETLASCSRLPRMGNSGIPKSKNKTSDNKKCPYCGGGFPLRGFLDHVAQCKANKEKEARSQRKIQQKEEEKKKESEAESSKGKAKKIS